MSVHAADGLVSQDEQTVHFLRPAADAIEFHREQLLALGHDHTRPVAADIGEGTIAESRHGLHAVRFGRSVKAVVKEGRVALEIDKHCVSHAARAVEFAPLHTVDRVAEWIRLVGDGALFHRIAGFFFGHQQTCIAARGGAFGVWNRVGRTEDRRWSWSWSWSWRRRRLS